jgi:hypothetical protein
MRKANNKDKPKGGRNALAAASAPETENKIAGGSGEGEVAGGSGSGEGDRGGDGGGIGAVDLNENENSAKETGYSCRRLRHTAGWASDIAGARATDPVLARALDPSFSECSSHGNNVVLMTGEAASKLALPNPNFVRVHGLNPVMVASPDVPFPGHSSMPLSLRWLSELEARTRRACRCR